MNKPAFKKIFGSFVIILTFSLLGLQQVAYAQDINLGPITGPITEPVTSFAHSISGKITLRIFNRFFRFENQPGSNILVNAVDIFTHKSFSGTTDSNGNYTIGVDNGFYQVEPQGSTVNKFFAPPLRFVQIKNNNRVNVDFQEFIF